MNATKQALTRRQFLRLSAAAGLAGATSISGISSFAPRSAASAQTALPSNADRAVATYDAQQQYLYRANVFPGDTSSLYLEQTPQGTTNAYSYTWPFSHATAGTLDLLRLPSGYGPYTSDVQDRVNNGLPHYWDGNAYESYVVAPLGSGGDRYYDDNAWTGLNLLRANRLAGNSAALKRAQNAFQFITGGWDNNRRDPSPGGVFWAQVNWNHDRNTCSNAPSAELAVRLYQLTGQQSYLKWAQKMYDWVRSTLLAPNGLYWDHIDLQGNINTVQWSYNQGTMIGAGALLYKTTGTSSYLTQAKATTQAALDYYAAAGYGSQTPSFNAIFFRNLLHLSAVDTTYLQATLQAMQGYADDIWQNNRDASTGLFQFPSGSSTTQLLYQAAALEVFACLAWDATQYDLLV